MKKPSLFWLFLLFAVAFPVPTGAGNAQLPVVQTNEPPAYEVSLKDLGYGDFSLRGMYGSTRLWVPFRSDWTFTEPVTLEVTYIASPLLHLRSTLTLYANDLELGSIHPVADGQPHTVSFTIPVDRLGGKGIVLDFQGYLRLTDDACEETNNPGQWVQILTRETRLRMQPQWRPAEANLSNLATKLVVRDAEVYGDPMPPLFFVLPDDPTPTELTVAGWVTARLAAEAGTLPVVRTIFASQAPWEDFGDAQVVVIGTPDRIPWLAEYGFQLPAPWTGRGFQDAQGETVPEVHGVIQILSAPGRPHRYMLVLSGATEAGLRRAGEAFQERRIFLALQGEYVFVGEYPPRVETLPPPPWTTDTTTFAQLGETDRRVRGTGEHSVYLYLLRPPGWVLDKGSQLVLRFLTSPALTSRESYIAVYINSVPVGAVRTGPEFPSEATLELPVTRLNRDPQGKVPSRFTVRLAVGNFMREQNCEQVHPEAAWTEIRADSYFVTPHVYFAVPDLQAFPYPFVQTEASAAAATLIVLPPSPTEQDIAHGLSLSGLLGRFAPHNVTFSLTRGDVVTEEDLKPAHLILLGEPDRQPWTSQALQKMPEVPGYRGQRGLYRALTSPLQGLLREGTSPWNPDRVVLLVFGNTPEGTAQAVQALLAQTPPVDQPGSVARVDEWGQTHILYRAITEAPVPEPGKVYQEPKVPPPQPWLVITGILLLAALAVVGLIVWVRWRYGNREA